MLSSVSPATSLHFHKRSQSITSKPIVHRSRIGQVGKALEKQTDMFGKQNNASANNVSRTAILEFKP